MNQIISALIILTLVIIANYLGNFTSPSYVDVMTLYGVLYLWFKDIDKETNSEQIIKSS